MIREVILEKQEHTLISVVDASRTMFYAAVGRGCVTIPFNYADRGAGLATYCWLILNRSSYPLDYYGYSSKIHSLQEAIERHLDNKMRVFQFSSAEERSQWIHETISKIKSANAGSEY